MSLHCNGHGQSFSIADLGGLEGIPYLKRLSLRGIYLTERELLACLSKHASTLKYLGMDGIILEEGMWESMFDRIRDLLALESAKVTLSRCRTTEGTWEQPWEDHWGTMEDYLLRKINANPIHATREKRAQHL